MTDEERAARRLDIAARLFSMAVPDGYNAYGAVLAADSLIRENERFEAPPNGRPPDAPVSTAIRERVLDLGHALAQEQIDIANVLKIFKSLRRACGVTDKDVAGHIPF